MLKTCLRALLAAALAVLMLSALAAVAALLLYGVVLALAAAILFYLAAPEDVRAFWRTLHAKTDGWLARIEALWASVRETIDRWGAAQMAAAGKTAQTDEADKPQAGSAQSVAPDAGKAESRQPAELPRTESPRE